MNDFTDQISHLDLNQRLLEWLSHPGLTIAGGISSIAVGVTNSLTTGLPILHEVCSLLSVIVGLIAVSIGVAVQIRRYRIHTIEERIKLLDEKRKLAQVASDTRHALFHKKP
jgi:hypothetical protein